ncbi:hypothetical protein HA402_011532 [Bradysia odoriphaga]|uniref:UPF0472 protein C16orf72 homolog n=1 Tax=Bradysia coprophila TaxID=38358 RepID=UPI00187DD330|nr:UPF0472 protein C16orf72 homolog [Bradysia coprophila]KAG4076058.1 hypothetical protein HA402_011532 [Bradysia odoriphaga]
MNEEDFFEEDFFEASSSSHFEAITSQPDYERVYLSERDLALRNCWSSFQESATSIAQLYKDRLSTNETGALWLPFQTAAGTVTTLYKESCDGMKRTNEAAVQYGYQRRTRELADWARSKRRRYIRKDELLSYLAGKSPPPIHSKVSTHHHHHHHSNNIKSDHPTTYTPHSQNSEVEMHTFKEALARRSRAPELYTFVAGEIARHCKRSASPLDVNMDVQSMSNKRQRFL